MLKAPYASINSTAIHILSDLYAFLLHLRQEHVTTSQTAGFSSWDYDRKPTRKPGEVLARQNQLRPEANPWSGKFH